MFRSGFIRPEVEAQIWRWRESLVGGGVVVLGVWIALNTRGFLAGLGVLAMVVGIALIVAGWQRARFRIGRAGAGLLRVDERQIIYYGPVAGGTITHEAIAEVVLNPLPRTGPIWELRDGSGEALRIPVDAAGAEALFDVFSGLPGFETEPMLSALADPGAVPRILWARTRSQIVGDVIPRLH